MIPCPKCGEELVSLPMGMGHGNPYEKICWNCGYNKLVNINHTNPCAECAAPIVWTIESGEQYLCVLCRA